MNIVCIGGGPASLYFAILMKRLDPAHRITVIERNRPDDTFGFGVVFSDKTLDNLAKEDRESHDAIQRAFWHWDDIHTHIKGRRFVSRGHGFAGMGRRRLLNILQARCAELGVVLRYREDVKTLAVAEGADLVFAADGVNSTVRSLLASEFQPAIDLRPNRFVWLGTTFPFDAFTFYFKENEHGLWRVHAYRYEEEASTFIVECTAETFARTGLSVEGEDATVAYCESLFAQELVGHRLLKNRSFWRQFPTIRNAHWHTRNIALAGDAVHTAHFSIGSGTKLALEDAIAMRDAIAAERDIPSALARYEKERRPVAESLQRAAQVSLEWFENTERYKGFEPEQFHASLLTRSLRITHDNLKRRDPTLGAALEGWFADKASKQSARVREKSAPVPPPAFTPFKLRHLVLENRIVVSPMCQYSATDGVVGDWHLVHLGSRAVGGAGLVMAEMTAVAPDARISPGCAGMYAPAHVPAWRRVVDFVHAQRGKIGLQLGHAGRKGSTQRAWEKADEPLASGNWPVFSASAIPWRPANQVPRAMDRGDMERVRDEHVRAARLAEEAGFDLLEIHAAHGYLLASFLSPLTNVREDGYGGSIENRMKFPLEVFDAVRAVWPAEKPISVRISASDWHPDGITLADVCAAARLLKAHGCDIVDVSAGQTVPDQRPVYGRLFQTPFADRVRNETGVPTMTVGNVKSYEDVNSILVAGRADLVLLARAHLWDPYLARHAARSMGHERPWPPQYAALDRFDPRFE